MCAFVTLNKKITYLLTYHACMYAYYGRPPLNRPPLGRPISYWLRLCGKS